MTSVGRKTCQAQTIWRPACWWEDTVIAELCLANRMLVCEVVHLAHDRDECQAFVNTIMIPGATQNVGTGSYLWI